MNMKELSKEWKEKAKTFAEGYFPEYEGRYSFSYQELQDYFSGSYLEGAKAMREAILKELDNTHPDWEDPYNHKECFERATLLKIFDNIKPVE